MNSPFVLPVDCAHHYSFQIILFIGSKHLMVETASQNLYKAATSIFYCVFSFVMLVLFSLCVPREFPNICNVVSTLLSVCFPFLVFYTHTTFFTLPLSYSQPPRKKLHQFSSTFLMTGVQIFLSLKKMLNCFTLHSLSRLFSK